MITPKESLITLIQQNGSCASLTCEICYFSNGSDGCCSIWKTTGPRVIQQAVEAYLEHFGTADDLIEYLL